MATYEQQADFDAASGADDEERDRRMDPRDAEITRLHAELARGLDWAWIPVDQTLACPCCSRAWWPDEDGGDVGDVLDDWHEPGCEYNAIRVAAGVSTGKKVALGALADDPQRRPDFTKVRASVAAMRAFVERLARDACFRKMRCTPDIEPCLPCAARAALASQK